MSPKKHQQLGELVLNRICEMGIGMQTLDELQWRQFFNGRAILMVRKHRKPGKTEVTLIPKPQLELGL